MSERSDTCLELLRYPVPERGPMLFLAGGTLISGRYVSFELLPFSFKEYGVARPEAPPEERFREYLQRGSFPYVATAPMDEFATKAYLEGIYSTILIKDVAQRGKIMDVDLLEQIVKTMASCIGSPISIKKIADTLQSAGRKVSVNSVTQVVQSLCDAYIFYKADRYDIKGRQHLKTLGKYYLVDTGLRSLLTATSTSDLGHLIENVVYLELRRRGYRVHVGKVGVQEVDFVAQRPGHSEILYIQVSATVLAEETLKRELAPLQQIKDQHPKLLLTLDRLGANSNYDGIHQRHLIDWLEE